MLTSHQVETIAFVNEYGEFICRDEATDLFFQGDGDGLRPVIRYELDEYQSQAEDDRHDADPDEHVEDCECLWPIYCESCGTVLVEEYVDTRCQDKQEGTDE